MSTKIVLGKNNFVQIATNMANPLFPLLNYAAIVGKPVSVEGNKAELEISDMTMFRLPTLLSVVSSGAEVYSYPCWIEIPIADYQNTVPSYMPYKTIFELTGVNNSPNIRDRKWSEYNDPSVHIELSGSMYIPSNILLGSDIKSLDDNGYNILDTVDYVTLMSS